MTNTFDLVGYASICVGKVHRLVPRVLMIGLCVLAADGCSSLECGEGTLEVDGTCVAPDDRVRCGAGFDVQGATCVPRQDWIQEYCDPATAEVRDGKCVGTGGSVALCTERCPEATGDKICISGRAVDFPSLLAKGPDQATKIAKADGVMLRIYDPLALLTNPSPTPLAEVALNNENGCFVVSGITLPFNGLVAAILEDDNGGRFARAAQAYVGTPGQNLVDQFLPVMTPAQVAAWSQDAFDKGSLAMWFVDGTTGLPVDGVKPLASGKEIPGALFVNADGSGIEAGATVTTKSGVVLVPQSTLSAHGGEKQGCTIDEHPGGSVAGSFFIAPFPVTGC